MDEKIELLKEFAEFKGVVSTTLNGIGSDISEIKADVKQSLKDCQSMGNRITKLETNKAIGDKIRDSWQKWVAIAISIAAFVYSALHK